MSSSLVAAGSTAESPSRQQGVPWHTQRCVNTQSQTQPQTHPGPQQHTLTRLQGTAIGLPRSHCCKQPKHSKACTRQHSTALPGTHPVCCKRFTAQPLCGNWQWRWRQQPQFCRLRRSSRPRLQCASRLWLLSQSQALTTPKERPPRARKAALEVLEARAWDVRAAARGCGRPLLVD